MARWEAEPKERLARAALDLFADKGYDSTTVADIVERAGLTKSTFFRHFTDKREVLFAGQDDLVSVLTGAVTAVPAPAGQAPVRYVEALLSALANQFSVEALVLGAKRAAVVSAHPDLRERDLLKRAQLVAALEHALNVRGVADVGARLAATVAVMAFDIALDRWATGAGADAFGDLLTGALQELVDRAGSLGQPLRR